MTNFFFSVQKGRQSAKRLTNLMPDISIKRKILIRDCHSFRFCIISGQKVRVELNWKTHSPEWQMVLNFSLASYKKQYQVFCFVFVFLVFLFAFFHFNTDVDYKSIRSSTLIQVIKIINGDQLNC